MRKNEFRWNKKRKHFAYLFKTIGLKRMNILITSKKYVYKNKRGYKKIVLTNVPLYRHPNTNKKGQFYLIPRKYLDDLCSFDERIYTEWEFSIHDKRKIKRIKKAKCSK